MKKWIACILGVAFMLSFAGCNSEKAPKIEPKGDIAPTVYNNAAVTDIASTEAGDIDTWQAQVFTSSGGNNDDPTQNALIKSPWHTLVINGKNVPVYTARCGKGSHSFAWVDVTSCQNDFVLEVSLSVDISFKKCVVLPESREVDVKIEENKCKAYLKEYGSYTFTFANNENANVTDPTLAPLTVMVTEEEPLEIPEGYEKVEIEPGYHADNELEFTEEEKVYVFKEGLHEISSIRIPSLSTVYLERGAYLKVTDRQDQNGSWNTQTAIHTEDSFGVKLLGRGLLDCGEVLGGDHKRKHVVNASRSEDVTIDGLTIINSNTWTMCFYNCVNATANRNLLLGYRTYSDGIMMSECIDSSGRYNFVRTGDDAIEFKGTGWGGVNTGENCIYEYNDLWTDKGSGYCITWESECDMTNMTFRNNSVGFAQPTWNASNNALDCRLGTNGNKTWSNITFENIEIYHVISPVVMIAQVTGRGANLENVLFKNISVKSTEIGVYAFKMTFSASAGGISNITMQNIDFCGKTLTAEDLNDPVLMKNDAGDKFSELSIL